MNINFKHYQSSIGKLLEQPFKKYNVKKVSVKYKNNEFRILYTEIENIVYILLIGNRENFYDKIDIKTIRDFLK